MSLTAVLIAQTTLYRDRLDQTPYKPHPFPSTDEVVMAPDELTEFAARLVYGSWDRPDPNTERNCDYLEYLRERNEDSFFEHASATFFVSGASLALAADLRVFAPYLTVTEQSFRFRNLADAESVLPPALVYDEDLTADFDGLFDEQRKAAGHIESLLKEKGFPHSGAREAALAIMPLATETSLLATGDMKSWPWAIEKSLEYDASPELYTLGMQVFAQLRTVAPNAVRGIEPIRKSRPAVLVPDRATLYDEYS